MPTAVAEEISQRTKAVAEKVEKELLELIGAQRYWSIAKLIDQIVEQSLWQVRGFETRSAYRIFLRIGRSTWHRYLRLYQNVAKPGLKRELLTWKSLQRLTLENADHLEKLPEKKRFTESWIQKALTMNEEEFEAAVDQALESGEDNPVQSTESPALLKIHCTSGQKAMILEGMEGFADKHGIPKDEWGRILELLMAEVKDCRNCGWVQ